MCHLYTIQNSVKHFLSMFLSTVPRGGAPRDGVPSAAASILLDISHLNRLYTIVKQDAVNWYDTGLHLGFLAGELDAIQSMPTLIVGGVEKYQEELLKRWLKRTNPRPYLHYLGNAIYRAGNQRLGAGLVQAWQQSQ